MTNIYQINISKLRKLLKYILMTLIVILATKYIPDIKLQNKEIYMIGAISAIVFAILDMISPSITIKNTQSNQPVVEAFKTVNNY
jgi:hypothetical protein